MQIQGSQGINAQTLLNRLNSAALTEDQKNQLEEIIAQYDPENFSLEDQQSMMQEIKSASIQPGKEMFLMMQAAGFSKPEGPPPPPPGDMKIGGIDNEQLTSLLDLLTMVQSGELTDKEVEEQIDAFRQQLSNSVGQIVDISI